MSVNNGQTANQTTFNDAFMSRIGNTNTSGSVTVGGNIVSSLQNNITAFAGGGQANATAITKDYAVITTAGGSGDSVKMPAAVPGLSIKILNFTNQEIAVFPQTGEQIDDLGANLSITIPAFNNIEVVSTDAGLWYTSQILDDATILTIKGLVVSGASTLILDTDGGVTAVITSTDETGGLDAIKIAVIGGEGSDGSLSGALIFESGQANGTGSNSGPVTISTGTVTGDGSSGDVSISTGSVVSGNRGFINLNAKVVTNDTVSIGGAMDMNGFKIADVLDPVAAQDAATKNYVDTAVGAGPPTVASAHTSAQSIADATDTIVSFTTEEYDSNTALTATRFTAPTTGYYHVDCGVAWTANATNSRYIRLKKNGTTYVTKIETSYAGNSYYQSISTDLSLTATDYVEVWAEQNSGVNLALDGSMANYLNVHKIR